MKTRQYLLEGFVIAVFLIGFISKILSFGRLPSWPPLASFQPDTVTGLNETTLLLMGMICDGAGLAVALLPVRKGFRGGAFVGISSIFLLYHMFALSNAKLSRCECMSGVADRIGLPGSVEVPLAVLSSIAILYQGLILVVGDSKVVSWVRNVSSGLRLPQVPGTRKGASSLALLLCALIVAVGGLLQSPVNHAVALGGEEHLFLLPATLLSEGFKIYSQIWFEEPPLLAFVYAGIRRIIGGDVCWPRLLSYALLILLITMLGKALAKRFGFLACILFTVCLLSIKETMILSISAMQEVPMAAIALLGVLSGQEYLRSGKLRAAILCCAGCWIASAIKLNAMLFILPLAAIVACRGIRDAQRRTVDLIIAFCLAMSPFAVALSSVVLFGRCAWSQIVHDWSNLGFGSYFPEARSYSLSLAEMLRYPWLYTAGALALVWLLVKRRCRLCVYEIGLLITVSAWAAFHKPWWTYYSFELGLAMSLIVAVGLADCIGHLGQALRDDSGHLMPSALMVPWLGSLLAATIVAAGPVRWHEGLDAMAFRASRESKECVKALRELSAETHWAFGEDGMYLVWAGMRVPPELAFLSQERMWRRQVADVRGMIRKYRPEVVLSRTRDARTNEWILGEGYKVRYGDAVECIYVLE